MHNIAVILAGGTGTRMGLDRPKQFLPLCGRTVIETAVEAFVSAPGIERTAVVIHPDWQKEMQHIIDRNAWTKVLPLILGGSERYESSLNAVRAFDGWPDDTNLILHDAARPWVSQAVIRRVAEALEIHPAVGVGIPSTDTVWEALPPENGGSPAIGRIPDRAIMWRAQTPQAFRLPLIRTAYQRALQDPLFKATDDCGVVLRYLPGVPIHIVEGEESNRKITFRADIGDGSPAQET